MHEHGYDMRQLEHLVNHQAGLLGVSGISPELKTLLKSVSTSRTRPRR
jgi:acetate kinase